MFLENLDKIEQAPKRGQLLVYTRNRVIFQPYGSLEEVKTLLKKEEILELHLFNTQKEYRCILSESKRYPKGRIEHLAEFPDCEESVYKEETLLENGGKLTVLNYLKYSDVSGMASIQEYRLVMEEI